MIEFKIYNEKLKDFNRAIVNNGAKKGQATKKLCEICEEVYKNVQDCNNDKSKWLGEHGGGLMEEDVVKILVRYNMYNPDLSMIDRMKGITSKQGWAWKRHIMKVEVKSFNITYVFLRQYMTLYTAEMTKEQSKSQGCAFSIGLLCDNIDKCLHCRKGLRGKKTIVKDTPLMGKGLFANVNIPTGSYIVKYEGDILKKNQNQ